MAPVWANVRSGTSPYPNKCLIATVGHAGSVPVVGRISAGSPVMAAENVEEYLPLPTSFATDDESFALRVSGDSMIGAGILDGDMVVVRRQGDARNGDIVAALLGGP